MTHQSGYACVASSAGLSSRDARTCFAVTASTSMPGSRQGCFRAGHCKLEHNPSSQVELHKNQKTQMGPVQSLVASLSHSLSRCLSLCSLLLSLSLARSLLQCPAICLLQVPQIRCPFPECKDLLKKSDAELARLRGLKSAKD